MCPGGLKILVVDDSFTMRLLISDLLNSEPDINVVDAVKSGEEALEKLPVLKPDCIILDVTMPGMDGLTALNIIMKKYPTPVVILSACCKQELDIAYKYLLAGAIGFVGKPSGELSMDIEKVRSELLEKIKIVTAVRANKFSELKSKNEIFQSGANNNKIIVIGSSMGGPKTIENVLTVLPADYNIPILIVQHIPEGIFLKNFVNRLNNKCWIDVKIIEHEEPVKGRTAYCVPHGYYVSLKEKKGKYFFNLKQDFHTQNSPSIDSTMLSLAEHYYDNIIGIILSGMGDDGVKGMRKIKSVGGVTIVQDDGATLYGMPKAVKDAGLADLVLSEERISKTLMELTNV